MEKQLTYWTATYCLCEGLSPIPLRSYAHKSFCCNVIAKESQKDNNAAKLGQSKNTMNSNIVW